MWLNIKEGIHILLSGRLKSKKTDSVGFITKIHISRYVDPIFVFFMCKISQHSVVLAYIFDFYLKDIFNGVNLKKKNIFFFKRNFIV